jgi:iron complex outermembrane receptor protein
MKRHITTTIAGLLVAHGALAQKDSSSVKEVHELKTIILKSIRAGAYSPFSKTDLNQKQIQEQNLGQDLPLLLNTTPSVVTSSDAGAGIGYTNMRIRGTDGTRINITLNGVPVNDAESQGTFFVNLPDLATSTNSIQVQRGVGTSTNGAGAFGATVSISNMEQRTEAGGSFSVSGGSFNTLRTSIQAGTGLLKNGLQFDVRLSKISSDGYIDRSESNLKSYQILSSWTINEKSKFRFMALSGSERTAQAWNGISADELRMNRKQNPLGLMQNGNYYDNQTDNYQQHYYQLFFDHKWNANWSINTGLFLTRGLGYYEEYRADEKYSSYDLKNPISPKGDTITRTDLIRQLWLDNYYYGGLFNLQYTKNSIAVTYGGSISQYSSLHYGKVKWANQGIAPDFSWYRTDAMKNDFNQYLKAQFDINQKLSIYGDLQLRIVSYFMNGFRKNTTLKPAVNYTFLNPKIGANYFIKKQHSNFQRLYTSLAVANKEPNRDDFEANTQQLPKHETLVNIESGYEIKASKWNFLANYYFMKYNNQLVLNGQINDVGAYTRINVKDSYRMGIELSGNYTFSNWLSFSGNATFSTNKIKTFNEFIDDYDNGDQVKVEHKNTNIAFAPSLIAFGQLGVTPFVNHKDLKAFQVNLMYKHIGNQYLDNTSNKDRMLPSYGLVDLRLMYNWKINNKNTVQFNLTVYNLLNKMYVSNGYNYSYIADGSLQNGNYYFPQAGTNILAGFNFNF